MKRVSWWLDTIRSSDFWILATTVFAWGFFMAWVLLEMWD